MKMFKILVAPILGIIAAYYMTLYNPRSGDEHDKSHQSEMTPLDVIKNFEKMAFDEYKPKEAVMQYFSPNVVDHDPQIKGDRDSIIAHLDRLDWSAESGNRPVREIKHIFNNGDIVAVVHHIIRKPGTRGVAALDMFRVKDGYVVEHWDILQDIPEESLNLMPMFFSSDVLTK